MARDFRQDYFADETIEERRDRAVRIIVALGTIYEEVYCTLDRRADPWELLVSTILAAQCTDARVNQIVPALFAEFPDSKAFAESTSEEIEPWIKTCGIFRNKAKSIHGAARALHERFGGAVPDNLVDLESLPGVGRKTANLILGECFGRPAIVVDTHCSRISQLLGLTAERTPLGIERELQEVLPPEHWIGWGHYMVEHGRNLCVSGRPQCGDCALVPYCAYALSESDESPER